MALRDWFPVITLLLGSVLTVIGGLVSEAYRNRSALQREHEDRVVQHEMERRAFQRVNLVGLQDAGRDLLDATGACFEEKWVLFLHKGDPATKSPKARPVSAEAEHARRKARIEVDVLISRVLDDKVRHSAYQLSKLSGEVIRLEDYDTAWRALEDMQAHFAEANEDVVGPHLRSLL